MEQLILFLASLRPDFAGAGGAPAACGRGAAAVAWPMLAARGNQSDMKRRLKVETKLPAVTAEPEKKKNVDAVREKAVKTAHEFYAKSDPENVARLRLKLIQAGYMDPGAVGTFFLDPLRLLLRLARLALSWSTTGWRARRRPPSAAGPSSSSPARAGYFLPGLAARPADLDQDARIPQRLS